jgi:uncharacterized tellurite resistance protein B-like protein
MKSEKVDMALCHLDEVKVRVKSLRNSLNSTQETNIEELSERLESANQGVRDLVDFASKHKDQLCQYEA